MQKTVRFLRIGLPILFLGFVALIAVSYTQTARREPAGEGQGERSVRKGDRPALVSYTFEDTQSIGGRIVSRVRARRTTGFRSGWYALEDAHLTVYRREGGTYELVAPLAQFNAKTKEAEISGGVRITSSDGMELRTQEVKFDGNRILNRIPVEFRIKQWTGRAGAVDLDVSNDRLRLFETVTATLRPAGPGEVPMAVDSSEAVFIRKFGEVKFDGGTTVTRASDQLRCDWIQARFDDRNEVLVELKGEGNLVVTLAPSSTMVAGGTEGEKRIEADRFFCELGPLGEIRAVNALGENGPARASLPGPPARRFTAPWFRLALEASVLRELKADNGVVLEESAPKGLRTLRASQVFVYFDPVTRQATSSLIQGNLEYRDQDVTANAERANYDIVADRMILTPVAGSLVNIVAQKNTIRAAIIELSPREQSMKATGRVAAALVSGNGGAASAADTSLFPSESPVYINADLGVFRQSTRTALFQGNVRAWQELNTIISNELVVQGEGDTVTAKGAVKVVLYNARGKEAARTTGSAARSPVVANSDSLTARKAERRVELAGNVRIQEMTRLLTTERAQLSFNAAKKLERVEALGAVKVSDRSVSRNGSGEKATYQITDQMLYLDGKPAELTDPRGTLRGEEIVYDIARNKAIISSGSAPSQSSYKPD